MPELADTDAAAIAGLWAEYGAALGRGDVDAVAALYTPDGDMIAIDGEHAIGRDAIADYYRRHADRFQGASIHDVEIMPPRSLSMDVALVNATWMVHGLRSHPFRVRTTFLVRRGPDGWRYVAVRFAAALAPP